MIWANKFLLWVGTENGFLSTEKRFENIFIKLMFNSGIIYWMPANIKCIWFNLKWFLNVLVTDLEKEMFWKGNSYL